MMIPKETGGYQGIREQKPRWKVARKREREEVGQCQGQSSPTKRQDGIVAKSFCSPLSGCMPLDRLFNPMNFIFFTCKLRIVIILT